MKSIFILVVLSFILSVISAEYTHPTDQAALTAFWQGLSSKGLLDWNTDQAVGICGQKGVSCGTYSASPQYGKVLGMNLGNSELVGTLASDLGQLTMMTFLSLYSNSLSGTLPTELGLLNSLTYLGLSKGWGTTKLTGTIPSQFGLLTSLSYLEMNDHAFSGTLPNELGQLSKLTMLSFATGPQPTGEVVRFSGTIPFSLSWLPLSELYLSPTTSNFCPMTYYANWATRTDFVSMLDGCRGCLGKGNTCARGVCSADYGWTCLCPQNFTGPTCDDVPILAVPDQQPAVIGLAVSCAFLAILVVVLAFLFWRKARKTRYPVELDEQFLDQETQ